MKPNLNLSFLLLPLLTPFMATALRFAMYVDQYHTVGLPGTEKTSAITHAIMAFAEDGLFNSDAEPTFKPFESVATFRARFAPETKILFAIGGWGDTTGFAEGAKDEASRERYARNVAAVVKKGGFDGVDIDWEYPGGNGDDYKKTPNSQKTGEIETFPLFLAAIRAALGPEKILSIAVPGKRMDMIAFTPEQGPKIFESVDMVNVMSYDLMNRRNNATIHHSSVVDSLDSVHAYQEVGLSADKINLGVAYYAKWFTTKGKCDPAHPIGCEVEPLETADGGDTGKSGVLTFEASTMAEAPKDLKESTDMTCGFNQKTYCPSGTCCSQYGNCGTGDDFCQTGCLSDYGECKGLSVIDSWRKALAEGQTDEQAGGQYYLDAANHLFWTWDTPATIARKFRDIVDQEKLGGVMAWSLGEDTLAWEHVDAMSEGVKQRS